MCMQEWFHFVDKEKQVRVRIDCKVNQMVSEAANLKAWTISEVSHQLTFELSEMQQKHVKQLSWYRM